MNTSRRNYTVTATSLCALTLAFACSETAPQMPPVAMSGSGGSSGGGAPPAGGGGMSGGAPVMAGAGMGGGLTAGGGMGGAPGGAGGISAGGMGGMGGGGGLAGPACSDAMGTNGTNNIRLDDPRLSVRRLGDAPAGNMIRLEPDPTDGTIYALADSGTVWTVNTETGATTEVFNAGAMGTGGAHRGMAFGPDGALYVLANSGDVSVTVRKGVPDGGGGRTWSTVATSGTYARGNTNFDHLFAGLVVSPDGQSLFISSGSRTDHGEVENGAREVPLTSAIFRVPTNANTNIPNEDAGLAGILYADGLRNAFDMAFDADGELFATDNGPDADFSEELNWIEEGKHYGFPWRLGLEQNPNTEPGYTPDGDARLTPGFQAIDNDTYFYEADFPPAPAAMVDPILNVGPNAGKYRIGKMGTVEDVAMTNAAMGTFTGHRSPLGLSFDAPGMLCGEYYKSGFVLAHGAFIDTLNDHGEDLSLLQLTKVGATYQVMVTTLAAGFTAPIDSAMVGNKIYVVEFGGGAGIYEITLPTPAL